MVETFCKQAGFIPTYSYEGDDLSSVIGFVSSGFGIAIVAPEDASSERVASLRLKDPAPRRSIGIGWVKDRYLTASATLFRDFVLRRQTIAMGQRN
jgi:DNA-binding transcriptional LysR family regulator